MGRRAQIHPLYCRKCNDGNSEMVKQLFFVVIAIGGQDNHLAIVRSMKVGFYINTLACTDCTD